MSYYEQPCSALDREHLVKRLADYLYRKPEVELQAGVCQVCGHALPVAYRAVKWKDGHAQTVDCLPGSEEAAKFEGRITAGTLPTYDEHGWWFFRQCACDAFGAEHTFGVSIWAEARSVVTDWIRERRKRELGITDSPEVEQMRPRRRANPQRMLG